MDKTRYKQLVDAFSERHGLAARGLTRRETEALYSAMAKISAREAADLMGISGSSVATYRRRAYGKLGVESAAGAIELLGPVVLESHGRTKDVEAGREAPDDDAAAHAAANAPAAVAPQLERKTLVSVALWLALALLELCSPGTETIQGRVAERLAMTVVLLGASLLLWRRSRKDDSRPVDGGGRDSEAAHDRAPSGPRRGRRLFAALACTTLWALPELEALPSFLAYGARFAALALGGDALLRGLARRGERSRGSYAVGFVLAAAIALVLWTLPGALGKAARAATALAAFLAMAGFAGALEPWAAPAVARPDARRSRLEKPSIALNRCTGQMAVVLSFSTCLAWSVFDYGYSPEAASAACMVLFSLMTLTGAALLWRLEGPHRAAAVACLSVCCAGALLGCVGAETALLAAVCLCFGLLLCGGATSSWFSTLFASARFAARLLLGAAAGCMAGSLVLWAGRSCAETLESGELVYNMALLAASVLAVAGFGFACVAIFAERGASGTGAALADEDKARVEALLRLRGLNRTQRDVVLLVAQGYDTDSIEKRLRVSRGAVNSARAAGYKLLGVQSRAELLELVTAELER